MANRRLISGASADVTGSNTGATRESGEPNVSGVSGGKSVWWTWTASVSGTVSLSTAGSSFDTTLGVYRGTSVNALTLVKSNDDENYGSGIYTSKLSFNAVAGQVYQFLVDGYGGETGNVRLALDQPAGRRISGLNAKPGYSGLSNHQRSGNWIVAHTVHHQSRLRQTREPVASVHAARTRTMQRTGSGVLQRTHDQVFSDCIGALLDTPALR